MICRHCNTPINLSFLDLGSAPPSNAYLTKGQLKEAECWYPLKLNVCTNCWLVQTEDYAEREALFTKDYSYLSSFSSSWIEHSKQYVKKMIQRFGLGENSLVIEIASNDGYLLQSVKQNGIPCFGVEPTSKAAKIARGKGIETIEAFFGAELADKLADQRGCADLIVANNVLAHVPDINDFVAGITRLLKPNGVATFEFPHLFKMVKNCQFDTAYHEHYSYLSFTVAKKILKSQKLKVFDVEELNTHGGSLRMYVHKEHTCSQKISENVSHMKAMEEIAGISSIGFYNNFQKRTEKVKNKFLEFLLNAKQKTKYVGAYGAAAKGNTLLNYAGIRSDLLPWVADRNPEKQGAYLPGSRIPVVDENYLKNERPGYVLILPWNLCEEVMAQLDYIREWGGKFVKVIPELEIL